MTNTENLRPWKPGQSGNLGGRPKRDAITAALREQLEAQAKAGTRSVADEIAGALIKRALKGDVRAIREIADRTEGRPRQQLEVEATTTVQRDLSRLTDEQLAQLVQLLEIAET
jgi:hypothetical protein